ncbi:MAG: YaaL family protein [Thermoflavifilum sp.]|nr:YaaL family protein [Thermoflavifilum sp.]MCL6515125.1 YaaL family protein [Alicyclobacillus sp.]
MRPVGRMPAKDPATPVPVTVLDGETGEVDVHAFLRELHRSKRELEIAQRQFDAAVDPLLIDDILYRLGAAEKHYNYMFQLARRLGVTVDGIDWTAYE